jgi:hypothetical protein
MKPIQPRAPTVIVGPHALQRWLERANRRPRKAHKLSALMAMLLDNRLAQGAQVDYTGAVRIELQNVTAVLRLGDGIWVCTTFLELGRMGNEN